MGRAIDQIEGIRANVTLVDLLTDEIHRDMALLEAISEESEEELHLMFV